MLNRYNSVDALCRAGISHTDAIALRRIAMTLHRWHELECGDSNDYASWCITRGHAPKREFYRDPETQAPRWRDIGEFTHNDDGAPYLERHYHRGDAKTTYTRIPDRERGALKRLAAIMTRYPQFAFYVQTDPRGCSLYILRPGDVPIGEDVSAYYSRGIAVCK